MHFAGRLAVFYYALALIERSDHQKDEPAIKRGERQDLVLLRIYARTGHDCHRQRGRQQTKPR